jgi:hypothetical protein
MHLEGPPLGSQDFFAGEYPLAKKSLEIPDV